MSTSIFKIFAKTFDALTPPTSPPKGGGGGKGGGKGGGGGGAPPPAAAGPVWVVFDGSGTPAILEDVGVTSLTDEGTGDYTITFDSNFLNDDYSVAGMCYGYTNNAYFVSLKHITDNPAVGSVRICTTFDADPIRDFAFVSVIIIGDV